MNPTLETGTWTNPEGLTVLDVYRQRSDGASELAVTEWICRTARPGCQILVDRFRERVGGAPVDIVAYSPLIFTVEINGREVPWRFWRDCPGCQVNYPEVFQIFHLMVALDDCFRRALGRFQSRSPRY